MHDECKSGWIGVRCAVVNGKVTCECPPAHTGARCEVARDVQYMIPYFYSFDSFKKNVGFVIDIKNQIDRLPYLVSMLKY